MRLIVQSIDKKKKIFYCILNQRREAFYLSNKLAKVFLPILEPYVLIDFEVGEKKIKKQGKTTTFVYPVTYFNYIEKLNPKIILYDLNTLRKDMKRVLDQYEYFLFLDCEMTMPGYKKGKFIPEIIQVGYILADKYKNVILDEGYYIKPLDEESINKRTVKFLNLDVEKFNNEAKDYHVFYEKLSSIINKYQPKIVVWGKNDVQAINYSYHLHKKEPLTYAHHFIDLLKLHKDYFNLSNDIKLFDAYKTYYGVTEQLNQEHNARTDAIVTKDVFDAFLIHMSESVEK